VSVGAACIAMNVRHSSLPKRCMAVARITSGAGGPLALSPENLIFRGDHREPQAGPADAPMGACPYRASVTGRRVIDLPCRPRDDARQAHCAFNVALRQG